MKLPNDMITVMYAEYSAGASLSDIGRRYGGRNRSTIRGLFSQRGLIIRPSATNDRPRDECGNLLPNPDHTPAQIERIIQTMTKIKIPVELSIEWRKWSLEKRADFIARIRARLQSPDDRPDLPFSDNVEPFDYGSQRAWEIVNRANQGLGSHYWKVKIDLCSQGVIYKGRLWFWSTKVGYQSGPWTPEGGRPSLHHTIWEEHTGSKVPTGFALRFADRNPNNLVPENLVLISRNDISRENQATGLTRKSRELTTILLNRTQQKGQSHDRIDIVSGLCRIRRKQPDV